MTVAELVAALSECDPDTRVVVSGYEGGVDDVRGLYPCTLALVALDAPSYGEHAQVDAEDGDAYPDAERVPAVHIWGGRDAPEDDA